ncbi:MAG: hypothetical protein KC549_14940 [Myxococcales bacterium]|nr:hypothetical protein [Myxococcales bacterium]
MVAYGGVANAAALDKSLAAMAEHRELKGLFSAVPGGYRLSPPDWHAVEIRTGARLTITTDLAALERKTTDGMAAALSALLTQPGLSALGALDIARVVKLTMLRGGDWEPPMPELQSDTPEAQAALKAWQAIQDELTANRKAREASAAEIVDRMISPLGHLAAAARLTEHGLEIEGGFFMRQSTVPQAMASLAREAAAMEAMQREANRKSEDLYRRLGEARERLQAADGPTKAIRDEAIIDDDDGKDAPAPRDEPPSDDKME